VFSGAIKGSPSLFFKLFLLPTPSAYFLIPLNAGESRKIFIFWKLDGDNIKVWSLNPRAEYPAFYFPAPSPGALSS
jgi:hypothetical protein